MNVRLLPVIFLGILLSTGCSDSSNSNPRPTPRVLEILVTNDDGIGAEGIDTLVNALLELEDVVVEVVAPAENQSGASDKTTEGDVVYEDSSTISGYMGVAVYGFPADAVNVALDELGLTPHLVVSGVNRGQNVGPFAALSGTVGAARTSAREGYPSVAVSGGLFEGLQYYDEAAMLVIEWIRENRDALVGGTASADYVTSFNVPGCTEGEIRELFEVPRATSIPEGASVFATDCSIEPESPPTTDVDAMIKGHAAQTEVELEF